MVLHPTHVLSECSGYGGLDIALQIADPDAKTVCYIEREAAAAANIVARMEDKTLHHAPIWSDLTTFDAAQWRGAVDFIIAGYPCQGESLAGKRMLDMDPRWVFGHIAKHARDADVSGMFCENVGGHLSGSFSIVASIMQDMGFTIAAGLFPASEVGASHKRERLFWLGWREDRLAHTKGEFARGLQKRKRTKDTRFSTTCSDMANTSSTDCEGWRAGYDPKGREKPNGHAGLVRGELAHPTGFIWGSSRNGMQEASNGSSNIPLFAPGPSDDRWQDIIKAAPALEPAVCGMADGTSSRNDRLRLCGNGVSPLAGAYAYATLKHALTEHFCAKWADELDMMEAAQ